MNNEEDSIIIGTTNYESFLNKRIFILLRDGRKLYTILRSYDQFGNLILEDTIERYYIDLEWAERSYNYSNITSTFQDNKTDNNQSNTFNQNIHKAFINPNPNSTDSNDINAINDSSYNDSNDQDDSGYYYHIIRGENVALIGEIVNFKIPHLNHFQIFFF